MCRIKRELNEVVVGSVRLWMIIIFIFVLIIAVILVALAVCAGKLGCWEGCSSVSEGHTFTSSDVYLVNFT